MMKNYYDWSIFNTYRAFRYRRRALAAMPLSLGLNPDGLTIPNAQPRRYLRGFFFAVERAKVVGFRSTLSSLRRLAW